MKWLILIPIHVYRQFYPSNWKRTCLFEETCSTFVYRTAYTHGFLAGCRTLKARFRRCRPNVGAS